jgi:L-serine dehydratase
VGKKTKVPIMTVLEEFYKMGPGPSSSHTMGAMHITYDSEASDGGLAVSVVLC